MVAMVACAHHGPGPKPMIPVRVRAGTLGTVRRAKWLMWRVSTWEKGSEMSGNNLPPGLAERLASGEITALLDGIGWDAREDFPIVNPLNGAPATVTSAIIGSLHVKGEVYDGFGSVLADVHASADDARACHDNWCSVARTLALVSEAKTVMADAVRNISIDPGDTFVV